MYSRRTSYLEEFHICSICYECYAANNARSQTKMSSTGKEPTVFILDTQYSSKIQTSLLCLKRLFPLNHCLYLLYLFFPQSSSPTLSALSSTNRKSSNSAILSAAGVEPVVVCVPAVLAPPVLRPLLLFPLNPDLPLVLVAWLLPLIGLEPPSTPLQSSRRPAALT